MTKARLLHYFPPAASPKSSQASQATNISERSSPTTARDLDSWCATHIDRKSSSLIYLLLICTGLSCEIVSGVKHSLPKSGHQKCPESDTFKMAA